MTIHGFKDNKCKEEIPEEIAVSPTEPTTNEKVWIDNENKIIKIKNDNGLYEEFYNENKIKNEITNLIKTTTGVISANTQQVTMTIPGLKTVINVYAHDTTITSYSSREIIGFNQNGETLTVTQAGTMKYDNYFRVVYI